ncbi:MAG TPA: transcriptional regulator [Mycobacteriales bacterium]|jgi:predicted ArsR family transcriptional regulator|nr:transcriptional regulator [Mycobacteriales bacterium]
MDQSEHQAHVDAQVNSVASLGEPVRRALYRFVVAQSESVSRDQAATGVDVARHVAKFHLDRLVTDGLLDVEYRRPDGRTGPGAGRPAKFYRRAERDIAVSLPERRYDLAGRIMAAAITDAAGSGATVETALRRAADAVGRKLAADARRAAEQPEADRQRDRHSDPIRAVRTVLDANGFAPTVAADRITLGNCPFHDLAADFPALVCGMNVDLIGALLDALGESTLRAQLDPAPGRCCVTVVRPGAATTVTYSA